MILFRDYFTKNTLFSRCKVFLVIIPTYNCGFRIMYNNSKTNKFGYFNIFFKKLISQNSFCSGHVLHYVQNQICLCRNCCSLPLFTIQNIHLKKHFYYFLVAMTTRVYIWRKKLLLAWPKYGSLRRITKK